MEVLKKDELSADAPVGALAPQDWMTDAATRRLFAILCADGRPARFVGGCVRNALAHRPVLDIDIATPLPPDQVLARLGEAGVRAIPTGLAHGTVTALIDGKSFEITTLRRDVETDGRHAKVAFTEDFAIDAGRRDFTINALSCDLDGAIYDPFGGIGDLAEGYIRFVGDPLQRIDEDRLRVLRYFRFTAHFGRPPADIDAMAACRARAGDLGGLSGERVAAELFKLLAAPEPVNALLQMQEARVLPAILPELQDFGRLRLVCFLESRGILHPLVTPEPLRRLAALLPEDGAPAEALAHRLKLSNSDRDRLIAMAEPSDPPDRLQTPQEWRRQLYQRGRGLFCDRTLLAWAGARSRDGHVASGDSERWRAMLDLALDWCAPEFPLSGEDVLAAGIPAGPLVGQLLRAVAAEWEASDFTLGRDNLLELLLKRIQATPI